MLLLGQLELELFVLSNLLIDDVVSELVEVLKLLFDELVHLCYLESGADLTSSSFFLISSTP